MEEPAPEGSGGDPNKSVLASDSEPEKLFDGSTCAWECGS